jgi:hypothetical protein
MQCRLSVGFLFLYVCVCNVCNVMYVPMCRYVAGVAGEALSLGRVASECGVVWCGWHVIAVSR